MEYDLENNPRAKQKLRWTKHVLANLPSWMYHYLIWRGYEPRCVERLMHSFYSDASGLAIHSVFDVNSWTVSNHFSTNVDTWMEDNARYDPMHKKTISQQPAQTSPASITFSDTVRKDYIRQLNNKPGVHCDDIGSHISGAIGWSIGTATSGGSTINEDGSANKMFRTKELALELAQSKKENAELKAKLPNLDSKFSPKPYLARR